MCAGLAANGLRLGDSFLRLLARTLEQMVVAVVIFFLDGYHALISGQTES